MGKKIMINDRLILHSEANELWYKTRAKDKHYVILKTEHLLVKLLEELSLQSEEVVSRENLVSKIWYGNKNVGNPALTKAISKLRKILEEIPGQSKELIETVPKKGYRLKAKAQVIFSEAEQRNLSKKTYSSKFRRAAIILGLFIAYLLIKLSLSGGMHQMMHQAGH